MIQATIKKAAAVMVCLAFAAALVAPAPASANDGDADLIFAGCNVMPTSSVILFWVKNINLSEICQVCITPQAGSAYCPVLDARTPANWVWTLDGSGGVIFQTYNQLECIQTGTTLPGFKLMVSDATNCCYDVTYKDFAGNVLCTTVECFSCGPVSVEDSSWGKVKALYN